MKEYNLHSDVFEKAEKVYGNPLPENVKNRLEWEVSHTEENHYEELYKTAADIMGQISISGCTVRGTTGCSLIAYLLGITDVNPILFDLRPELLMGLEGDKPPVLSVNVSNSQYNSVLQRLGLDEVDYKKASDNHDLAPELTTSVYCELIQELARKTSLQPEKINYEETIEEFNRIEKDGNVDLVTFDDLEIMGDAEVVREMIQYLQPHTFDDYVKIFSAAHGTNVWEGMQRELVRADMIKMDDFISSRDDVYDFLIQVGLDRSDALENSERIRKGKGVSEHLKLLLLDMDVPKWRIIILDEMKYVFPRAHGISYMKLFWRLVYYRMHFGDTVYMQCLSDVKDKFGCEE
ncbi:MAG: hypothetical protein LUJ25_02320 [Firmicutes bacterium]|nr:hypothetical protein [Bacillota bacterium]